MKTIFTTLAIFCLTMGSYAQEQQDSLEAKKVVLDEVFVSAIRVTKESPVTFSNLTKEQLKSRNLGQDIPILMNFLPSVVTTSDAGAGIGYTGIRVRGSDATRVNVTINGVPYNDPESQGTFWVNMPDFSSSTQSLQLQRGVGTSTNGAGAFGASLNILTDGFSEEAYAQIASSIGSYNTLKNSIKFSTGLLNNHIEISGRLSRITSDGYIDRASSDLDSYFLQGTYKSDKTLIKALLFGGHEITYQAWYGFDAATINAIGQNGDIGTNRTYNIAGVQFDDEGIFQKFYENQVDNYKQNHVQLLWNQQINSNWSSNIALHYTRGRGFFEEYVDDWYYSNILFKEDSKLSFLGSENININGEEVSSTDYIRRRWLDNHFYGTTFSANYKNENLDFIFGGALNKYEGGHYGEVIWAEIANSINYGDRYYDDDSEKTDFSFYTKANFSFSDKWSVYGDLQLRKVGYEANSEDTGIVDDSFTFFNPKAGMTFDLNKNNNFYLSYAIANREPNRNDYENGNPKPERLGDLELGWRYVSPTIQLNTNMYYMKYKDQLVLTGELNDVGAPLRANVGDSYRLGLEIEANVALGEHFALRPNITLSQNKNKDFVFQRDGVVQNLGDTEISFSPSVVAGGAFAYMPKDNIQIALLGKFVGEQYMGNIDAEGSKLDSYSQFDFNVQYEINTNSFIKSIVLSGLVNNILNEEFVSNGYFYTFDDTWSNPGSTTTIEGAGYYPQAGTNFLLGATLNF